MVDFGKLARRVRDIAGKEYVHEATNDDICYRIGEEMPALVVKPGNPIEIAEIVKTVMASDVCLVPWGGGTMMGRGHVPAAYDIAMDLSRVAEVVDFDVANLTTTVQGGLPVAKLQSVLQKENQFLPLSPRSPNQATVGGTTAANANGPGRFRYGSVRDLVLGMRVVLANGEIIHMGGKTVKNVAGYDLSKIFIGSYGSLGVISEVTFRLLPRPQRQTAVRIAIDGLDSALESTARILDSELITTSLSIVTPNASEWLFKEPAESHTLVIDIDGSDETVTRQVRQIEATMTGIAAVRDLSILDGADRSSLMEKVRDFVPLGIAGSRQMAFTANVPLASAGGFVSAIENNAAQLDSSVGCLVAADTGTISCLAEGADISALSGIYGEAIAAAREAGGHCVLDQAPPAVRNQVPVWGYPRDDWSVTKMLKNKFDPQNLLNRGRFVDRT